MIKLNSKQRKLLEKSAQPLNALVQIGGAGLTEEQVKNISNVLDSHELVKIKYNLIKSLAVTEEREQVASSRKNFDEEISIKTDSAHVRTIGNVAIFYKPAKDAGCRKFEKKLEKLN